MVTDSDSPRRGRADVLSFFFFSSGVGHPAKEPKEQWHSLSGESAEDKSGLVSCTDPSGEQSPCARAAAPQAGLLPFPQPPSSDPSRAAAKPAPSFPRLLREARRLQQTGLLLGSGAGNWCDWYGKAQRHRAGKGAW